MFENFAQSRCKISEINANLRVCELTKKIEMSEPFEKMCEGCIQRPGLLSWMSWISRVRNANEGDEMRVRPK